MRCKWAYLGYQRFFKSKSEMMIDVVLPTCKETTVTYYILALHSVPYEAQVLSCSEKIGVIILLHQRHDIHNCEI